MSENDRLEHSAKLNGYRPRSYGDIVAVAVLLSMLVSTVAWGLKLEGELNKVRDDVTQLRAQVGQGILPRAEERIQSLRRDLNYLVEELHEHEGLSDAAAHDKRP